GGAERQPPGSLARVVLLSAAVSPGCDLTGALRASRGGVVSFCSSLDRMWLGAGTTQFGTADRVYGPAAGLSGFTLPEGLDDEGRRLYRGLVQVPWHAGLLREGNVGSHHFAVRRDFRARQVAPGPRGGGSPPPGAPG